MPVKIQSSKSALSSTPGIPPARGAGAAALREGVMKAVQKPGPVPGAKLITAPIPKIKPNEVLAKVKATSICGTDVHIFEWDAWAQKRIPTPLIFGHEFAASVVEVGKDVSSVKVGDLISGETHIPCGACFQCKTGNAHICENVKFRGLDVQGCFAEYVAVPETTAWVNPKGILPELAAAQEPLGNAVHTTFEGGGVEGMKVYVAGSGPIGACCAALCVAAGAEKVVISDISDYRLGVARKMSNGSPRVRTVNVNKEDPYNVLMDETNGRGVDVFLEVSGNEAAMKTGFRALRFGGRASMLGVFGKNITDWDLTNAIVFKQARVFGISGRKMFDTWFKTSAFLRSGQIDLSKLVTHKFNGLESFEKAFETMRSGQSGKCVMML